MKLWLWKNGSIEFWAFDNPYPINFKDGDPQTLGEPCGYAIFKHSRTGRSDRSEEQVLSAIKRAQPHRDLMMFYGVTTLEELVEKQAYHIQRLQSKLPKAPCLLPNRVRE